MRQVSHSWIVQSYHIVILRCLLLNFIAGFSRRDVHELFALFQDLRIDLQKILVNYLCLITNKSWRNFNMKSKINFIDIGWAFPPTRVKIWCHSISLCLIYCPRGLFPCRVMQSVKLWLTLIFRWWIHCSLLIYSINSFERLFASKGFFNLELSIESTLELVLLKLKAS